MKKTMKMSLLGMASVAAIAAPVALAVSCGGADGFTFKPATGPASTPVTKNSVRLVTDGGTINDQSFNQEAWKALKTITEDDNISETEYQLQSKPYGDINGIVSSYRTYASNPGVNTILATGFNHVTAMQRFINDTNNRLNFILDDGEVDSPNVASIIFKTDQAAFLAGNLAARYLTEVKVGDSDPKVGMFGGGPFPGVTDFMKGFVEGIAYFNANNGNGRDVAFAKLATDSAYTNTGFTKGQGKATADALIQKGADVILPVAGQQISDVIDAIGNRTDIKIIGVDTDQSVVYPNSSQLFLTSIKKEIQKSFVNVFYEVDNDTSTNAPDDSFKGFGETTVGTLDNELVGITAPSFAEGTTNTEGTTKSIADIYSEITADDSAIMNIAKADPKFTTWDQALAYINDAPNPYATA